MRHKLRDSFVKNVTKPGRHSDGDGLFLSVSKAGSKSWVFLYQRHKRRRELGLGSYRHVSLALAREKAEQARQILGQGGDPAMELKGRSASRGVTFGYAADEFLKMREDGWKNPKHRAQWHMTLTKYAEPIRPLPVNAIEADDILRVLRPIWAEIPETAYRLRGRIENVLDYAAIMRWRTGDNPARWKGFLEHALPQNERSRVKHHAAMPYADLPDFFGQLSTRHTSAALALQFTILTAARTTEVLEARWLEIDLDEALWSVPAQRMKATRDHRVPLTDEALAVLEAAKAMRVSEFIFPGQKEGRPLSNMALANALKRIAGQDVQATVHGFRSSFRDWAGEETQHQRETIEAALAHVLGDKTERAYRRADALEKRRALMVDWAKFLVESHD